MVIEYYIYIYTYIYIYMLAQKIDPFRGPLFGNPSLESQNYQELESILLLKGFQKAGK